MEHDRKVNKLNWLRDFDNSYKKKNRVSNKMWRFQVSESGLGGISIPNYNTIAEAMLTLCLKIMKMKFHLV